jgi:hypothetical protein
VDLDSTFISERIHKLNTLRFWVKLWCQTDLYDSSISNVLLIQSSEVLPHDPPF